MSDTNDILFRWFSGGVDPNVETAGELVASHMSDVYVCDKANMLNDRVFPACESEIEVLFVAAIETFGREFFENIVYRVRSGAGSFLFVGDCGDYFSRLTVEPQKTVGQYRADFFLTFSEYGPGDDGRGAYYVRNLVVECDGHNFHERTPEQARRDRKRDRYFQRMGLRVRS